MPRLRSEATRTTIFLSQEDRERAKRIAIRFNLMVKQGASVGQPDESAAIRLALQIVAEQDQEELLIFEPKGILEEIG